MTGNLRELEKELQIRSRMAAVGEMVAGVAHQIRNPLAIMKVSAEMIRDSVPALAGPELAVSAGAETAKREGAIRLAPEPPPSEDKNVAGLPRAGLGGQYPSPHRHDRQRDRVPRGDRLQVPRLHEAAQGELRGGGYRGIPGEGHLARPDGPATRAASFGSPCRRGAEKARFDRRLMEQALRNLVTNALAATDPGGIVLSAPSACRPAMPVAAASASS